MWTKKKTFSWGGQLVPNYLGFVRRQLPGTYKKGLKNASQRLPVTMLRPRPTLRWALVVPRRRVSVLRPSAHPSLAPQRRAAASTARRHTPLPPTAAAAAAAAAASASGRVGGVARCAASAPRVSFGHVRSHKGLMSHQEPISDGQFDAFSAPEAQKKKKKKGNNKRVVFLSDV